MTLRVLAVDPGLTRCGIAVVDALASRKIRLVDVRLVRTSAADGIGKRLALIETALLEVIAECQPQAVAIEQVFSQVNIRTVVGTAQAAGVAALVAQRRGLDAAFHTPTEVKAAVTGSGVADKAQVAAMVARIVGRHVPGPADATDAVALAICHSWRRDLQRRHRQLSVAAS